MPYLRITAQSWDKSRWCRIFGHKIMGYYKVDAPYGEAVHTGTDGLNVKHMTVIARCDRCDQRIPVIKFHQKNEP